MALAKLMGTGGMTNEQLANGLGMGLDGPGPVWPGNETDEHVSSAIS
jgi:hypothetical protein